MDRIELGLWYLFPIMLQRLTEFMIEMEIDIGGRVYQFRAKDVLWGSNPTTLMAVALH